MKLFNASIRFGYMKGFLAGLLLLIAELAAFCTFLCAFLTFATNDYRPIIVCGIGCGLLTFSCLWASIRLGRKITLVENIVVFLPAVIGLVDLIWRAVFIAWW